ncbi:MAG: MarC family NAAT transporter [Phycisphaerales bacterium]|nr:MarC family NAAT transporter [Planctomycetota bacterium]MCH8507621.1 MarC family NAAT transporter [Phycisphaerales bacterium]
MMHWFNITLATLVALLPIANPFSTAAVFLGITSNISASKRNRQAIRACVYMFVILVSFLVAGTLIMEFFGISIPGLRIAGGLMITLIAMSMLRPADEPPVDEEEEREARKKPDVSFTPLAMPSLSGPGAIAVTIGLATEADRLQDFAAIVVGLAVVTLICLAALLASTKVVRFLGVNGMNAMTRIMGFLLLCVGIQFIINGIIGVVAEESFMERILEMYHRASVSVDA